MDIKIKSIDIHNFKGIERLAFSFKGGVNEFRGTNGSGKTTLADAFFWCLYGKDSQGRTDFDIKRLDENGNIIYRENHTVNVVLDADGETIKLTRRLTEEWVRRRGDSEETFKGNKVEREWDGVPVTQMEFDMKLSSIASEEVMKLTILPLYFLQQPVKTQREFLMRMAGNVTYEQIAETNPEFGWVVDTLKSKTLEEIAKMLKNEIATYKKNIDTIPARIDENNRNLPCEENWQELEEQITNLQTEIENIDKQIEDKAEAYNIQAKEKQELSKQYSQALAKISEREIEVQKEQSSSYVQQSKLQTQLKNEKNTLLANISVKRSHIDNLTKAIADLETKRGLLLHKYREIERQTFHLDESQLICPTCGQQLPSDKADEKREEMLANWNENHAKMVSQNITEGKAVKAEIEAKQAQINGYNDEIEKFQQRLNEIEKNPLLTAELTQDEVKDDAVLTKLKEEANALKIKYDTYELKMPDTSFLKSRKSTLNIEVSQIKAKLANRERIAEIQNRNKELEQERNNTLNAIATVEGKMFTVEQFKKSYINAVEESVNKLFSLVKWRMYEPQINGGEKETCIALVNGVPYGRSLNTAANINAGIDIINTISKFYNVTSPIWIDNKESVVNIIDTDSQIICLVVDENYERITKTI